MEPAAKTTFWKTWLRRPQNLWLRRAIFQVHLWSGMLLGVYVVVVCVSGSAIVFRNDLEDILAKKTRIQVSGKPMSKDALKQTAQRAHVVESGDAARSDHWNRRQPRRVREHR
jgi:uncharacterized iron-regulated membrane protein